MDRIQIHTDPVVHALNSPSPQPEPTHCEQCTRPFNGEETFHCARGCRGGWHSECLLQHNLEHEELNMFNKGAQ